MSKYVAVTGTAGFIGRVVAKKLLARGDRVYGVDALTYAASPRFVEAMQHEYPEHFCFVRNSIDQLGRWPDVDAIIHLAAETHVDNSIEAGGGFVVTNTMGTARLLEMTRAKSQHGAPHFIQISTDEVYGPVLKGDVTEFAPLNPTSPYAASKAAADMLVQAWGKTYDVPYCIIRPTNAYGPNQYPEKLIPKAIRSILLGRPVPIHGNGEQTRCWLNVEDAADAMILALDQRLEGIYNVGGNTEASVRDVVLAITREMGSGTAQDGFVRPAGDLRYAVDDSKIRAAGWAPRGVFWSDLPGLVEQERRNFRF